MLTTCYCLYQILSPPEASGSTLYSLYSLLLSKLKQDLERWDFLPLSLGGRINTVKIYTLLL